jgi:hypothetical protein
MTLPLADIIGMLQQGVGNLLRETGLALMQTVMEEEVRQLAGDLDILAHSPKRYNSPVATMSLVCDLSGRIHI